ncbi:bZIP transcription factor TGA10-like isoform X1 [Zingiber officinale]|uniref:bZIP transcription factor TGA10-like isoform X1 n=1 Tax=Zingiber officinale TaxID=94328 RepID=UPI001C4D6203|nr:bZIP transcription factor TGA10-like isoform X1 [Zingiber officinale]
MANKGSSGGHGYQHHQAEQQQQQISFAMIHPSSSSSSSMHASFMRSKESAGAYDLGELDQALFMYLDGQDHSVQEQRQTLNIFPSQPMHVEPPSNSYKGGGISLASPSSSGSKKSNSEQAMELANSKKLDSPPALPHDHAKDSKSAVKKEGSRKGATGADHEGPKTPDPKTLRRLAQNREAARKSRLRKKAYIQQLETSRIKLSQIEQELHRARSQGLLYGGGAGAGALLGDQGLPSGVGGLSSDAAAMFDMEYGRWLEEHHRLMMELRAAVQEHPPENKLRVFVDSCVAHYDQMASLKSMVIKTDVFHLLSGTWLTPAERCSMWMGGFRPSDLLKMLLSHIEPLTEQQLLAVCGLQQSTHETEEALSQGHGALNQSLLDTVTSDGLSCGASDVGNYMGQMVAAMNKLATLEEFVRQADHLRQQTLHRLYQFLTTRQMARCLLAVAEYFHRLRALSSLWVARPRQE